MNIKSAFIILLVSALLIGSVSAASVDGFTVDKNYKSIYSGEYFAVYATDNQDSGVSIFKNVNDDAYGDIENDDILDSLIHHDGREYIVADEDLALTKNPDNIANFTDHEHATSGASEIVQKDGEEFIVVFWAQNSSNSTDAMSLINAFNKENNVSPVAF